MKRVIVVAFVVLLACGGSLAATYTITFDEEHPLRARIEADLPAGSRALKMTAWGASQHPNGWGSFVSGLEANAVLTAGPNATWTADTDGPLHLTYEVDLSFASSAWPAGNEQAGYFEDGALYVVSKALFIVSDVPGERLVTFRVPQRWTVASAWEPAGPPATFRARNERDLVDNSVVVGRFARHDLAVGNFHVTLALIGRMRASRAPIEHALQKILHAYGEVWGVAPAGRYLLTLFAADSTDAEAFAASAAFTEERAPTKANAIGWANTIAHELFHSWNGHRIAAADYASSQWLSEGFTEYFANLALVQEGLIPMELFLGKVEKMLGLYVYFRSSPAFRDVSLAEAGANKGRHRLGVYNGGWATAFCLDMEIRAATGGRRTLRDFMRLMDRRFGATETRYTVADVIAVAGETAGKDMQPFFERYVVGKEMLPVVQCLRQAGFDGDTAYYNGEVYVRPSAERASAVWPHWTK